MLKRLWWLLGALIPVVGLLYIRWVAVNAGLSLDMPRCGWELVVGDSVQLPGPRGESPYGELQIFRVHFDFRSHPGLFSWSIDSIPGRSPAVAIDRSGMVRALTQGIAPIKGDWPGPWRAGRPVYEEIYVRPTTLQRIELSASRDTIALHDSVQVRYVLRGANGDSLPWILRPPSEPQVDPDGPLYRMFRHGFVYQGVRSGTGTVEMCVGSRHASVTVVVR